MFALKHHLPEVLALTALLSGGCADATSMSVSGELTFEGVLVPGEISFEPLDAKGHAAGRAVTISVPESGTFNAALPRRTQSPQPFRLVLRVAPPRPTSALSENVTAFSAEVKTISLNRELQDGKKLLLAITQ